MDMEYIKQNAVGNGKCGENLYWYFLEGTLLISGIGAIILSENMENWEKLSLTSFLCRNIRYIVLGKHILKVFKRWW